MMIDASDENGMAYIMLKDAPVAKTVERTVNYDLDKEGLLIGIELFDCPPIGVADDYESGLWEGERIERKRIIKLLEDVKADLRKKLSEVSGDSQSETYWYSRIQQLDNYIALIKGENKPFITTKQAEELTNEMLEE